MCALLVQQGLLKILENESKLDVTMAGKDRISLLEKAYITFVPSLGEKVLR